MGVLSKMPGSPHPLSFEFAGLWETAAPTMVERGAPLDLGSGVPEKEA
jgi:hypothetical protein